MAPKRFHFRSKSYSLFIGPVVICLLTMSCGLPASLLGSAATPLSPSPSSLIELASPTVLPSPTIETTTETPTVVPPSPTPTVVLPSSTPLATATRSIPLGSIVLASDTTASTLTGTLKPGQVVTYTIGAGQSQPMTLIADSPHNDVSLGVFEENGNVLLDPALKQNAWQMALPSTELYTIKVIGGATTEDYILTVKMPQMVTLAPDTTSTTLTGKTAHGYLYSYALNLNAGQALTASLNVPSSTAYIDIYGLVTGTLLSASSEVNTWTGTLSQTQGYVIEVVPVNNQVVDYTLTVSITTAVASGSAGSGTITLAPGTTAAIVQGTVQPGQVLTYTVQAGKAQPIILLLESPKTDVILGFLNPDGSVLLSPTNKWSYWQKQLPATGLYTIQVNGGKTTETYTLTVKLPKLVYFPTEPKTVTLHGNTYPGYVVSYAFRISGGMSMTVSLDAPSGEAFIDVFGIATGSLLSFKEGATSWSGKLPETQEYVVEVVPRHGASVVYSLKVSVP